MRCCKLKDRQYNGKNKEKRWKDKQWWQNTTQTRGSSDFISLTPIHADNSCSVKSIFKKKKLFIYFIPLLIFNSLK